jgi:hypothetical protein
MSRRHRRRRVEPQAIREPASRELAEALAVADERARRAPHLAHTLRAHAEHQALHVEAPEPACSWCQNAEAARTRFVDLDDAELT